MCGANEIPKKCTEIAVGENVLFEELPARSRGSCGAEIGCLSEKEALVAKDQKDRTGFGCASLMAMEGRLPVTEGPLREKGPRSMSELIL